LPTRNLLEVNKRYLARTAGSDATGFRTCSHDSDADTVCGISDEIVSV
jgi:hypothetical protein